MSQLPVGLLQSFKISESLPDFDVTWAGGHPFRDGFCFGSDSGKLLFTDESGKVLDGPRKASASGEAINGLAGSGGWLAVTTRAEVNFFGPARSSDGRAEGVVFPGGAHGVVTAPSGYFVAALGHSGILFVKPGSGAEDPITISNADKEGLSFYRVIALAGEQGEDLIVCAGRRGGIGVSSFRPDWEEHKLSNVTFDDLDIVDVCPIGSEQHPLAVAALANDGTIVLIRDVLHDRKPETRRFRVVEGIAYRVLSARGHIFLLTSNGLYALGKRAERFLNGTQVGNYVTQVLPFPMETVDANLVRDQWLLVVATDELYKFNVEILNDWLHENERDHSGAGEVQELALSPEWQERGIAQKTEFLAPV